MSYILLINQLGATGIKGLVVFEIVYGCVRILYPLDCGEGGGGGGGGGRAISYVVCMRFLCHSTCIIATLQALAYNI